MPPDLGDALGAGNQPDDQRTLQREKLGRCGNFRDDGNVGRPDAALCQINRCRRLRCAAYPQDDDLGFFDVVDALTVVMRHGEIERVDPLEVVGVQRMLSRHLRRGLGVEILRQYCNDGIEDRHARDSQGLAVLFKMLADFRVDKGEQDDAGLLFDLAQCAIELRRSPDQCIDMGNRPEVGILGGRGLCHGIECFTRRIGDEVKMVITL